MRAAGFIVLLVCATAHADRGHVLVAIGNNVGDPDDAVLRYAEKDAQRFAQVFRELGGVGPEDALLVTGQDAESVRSILQKARRRIQAIARSGRPTQLTVYVSSHAAAGKLHLRGSHLPLDELRRFLSDSGASVRVLVVDACEGGTAITRKGGTRAVPHVVKVEPLSLEGQVVITSTGPAEAAEEWDALAGSLFTHHLLAGLRGNADGERDGAVSLAEAYRYAHVRTVAFSATGSQHPAFDYDLSGAGELILTRPDVSRSAVLFPADSQGQYVLASAPNPDVVVEVHKQSGAPMRVAVPPGRYTVRKKMGHRVGIVSLELPYGGVRTFEEDEMSVRHFTEVALKGGAVELHPWSLFLVGATDAAPVVGTGGRLRAGIGARRTVGTFWFLASASVGRASYRGKDLSTSESRWALDVAAGHRFHWNPVMPYLGVTASASLLEQAYTRDNEEEIRRVTGTPGIPTRRSFSVALGPTAGLEVPLVGRTFMMADASLFVRRLPAMDQPEWTVGASARLAAGWRF